MSDQQPTPPVPPITPDGASATGFNPDEWMSTREAAAVLGCSPSTLRRRIDAGEIPHMQKGGHLRVPRSAVEAEAAGQFLQATASVGTIAGGLSRDVLARQSIGIKEWDELPPFLTLPEVAKYYRLDVRRIRQSVRKGTIPSVVFSSQHMVPKAAFIELLTRAPGA